MSRTAETGNSGQPPVKIVEYANFLADVVTRLITDADAEVGRWKEFLEKSSQLPPTDRARVYDALEAVIATEAGNGQLQSAVWQTLRNITGQTLSSRTLPGRFLFEEVELLQVLMERLGPGSAFVEQCGSCRAYAQPPGHQTTW